MKIKTAEATPLQLDWVVAVLEGRKPSLYGPTESAVRFNAGIKPHVRVENLYDGNYAARDNYWSPSTDWAQGGPIIEREKIELFHYGASDTWEGQIIEHVQYGPTPLIAAMRCYVASKLGDEVELPLRAGDGTDSTGHGG